MHLTDLGTGHGLCDLIDGIDQIAQLRLVYQYSYFETTDRRIGQITINGPYDDVLWWIGFPSQVLNECCVHEFIHLLLGYSAYILVFITSRCVTPGGNDSTALSLGNDVKNHLGAVLYDVDKTLFVIGLDLN